MKQQIISALRLTLVCIIFFMVIYPLLVWAVAQVTPAKGKGETVTANNKIVGYKLEGQKFTDDRYFINRPSAVDYNAAGSAGSNKGPTNPDYLKTVQDRIDTFLVHNPGVKKEDIPSELVTASGSGLDPDLSPAAAFVQVKRIAKTRNVPEQQLNDLVAKNIEQPLLGLFGTSRVNVLQLNIQLDKMKK